MKKTKTGHYQYTIEELESLNLSELSQRVLFGNTIAEMKQIQKELYEEE